MSDRPGLRHFLPEFGTLPSGPQNTIADVPGLLVGHSTVIEGDDIRTGVTVIRHESRDVFREPCIAAAHVTNGFGKSLGLVQVAELGRIETPVALTNTLSVWTVADALVDWTLEGNPSAVSINPVVGECNDSALNDIVGRHVQRDHVFEALAQATDDPIAAGNVGAGTGMSGFGCKGGIGAASRRAECRTGRHTVGILVVCNTGSRGDLVIGGYPVGRELDRRAREAEAPATEDGSIIVVLATDAPLSSRQLGRAVRRTTHGLARTGLVSSHGSGDITIGFSTAEPSSRFDERRDITRLFRAAIEATEEAVIDAVLRCETMTGRNGTVREALPLDQLAAILQAYQNACP